MLVIKLSRTGKKKQPYYRIVVLEKSKDPWGDYLELLGNYNPRTKKLNIQEDRVKYWISVGAQMTNSIHNLMAKNNIIEDNPRKSVKLSKKRKVKLESKKAAAEEKITADKIAKEAPPAETTDESIEEAPEVKEETKKTEVEAPAEVKEKVKSEEAPTEVKEEVVEEKVETKEETTEDKKEIKKETPAKKSKEKTSEIPAEEK